MPVCFICFFCTVYCNENRLKNNMTPYEPRHEKTCLGTDHLILCGGGGGGTGFFSSRFSSNRKTEIFFLTVREPKYFFQDKAKTFLEPNIHRYIVYMFVYTCILDIWVRVYLSRDMTKPTKWLCAHRRLISAWASAQSDQSLCCPHEEALGP